MADSASSTKTCSRCHELKPVSEFNKDRNREDGRSRYCSHCHREKLRRYRERDRATHNANRALWREANIEKVREYARNWYASNRAPKKEEKGGRPWEALVGYTVHQLRTHLERQFRDGMSWGNRSLWHIDHIIPLSSFRFSSVDDPEFKAAWAMTNLRPLWAADNIRKHGKRQTLL